ncbi:DgyrCDS5782 [Dimorphilus gyrociliatus]|uniref:Ubiquitin carboxyl-terminal hydrolase n=1 Tax=Dimorphilus gyrociliatus TaxID=2664684 RepID=A0A7I8VNM8_9ANNE|nr:DgyrCDS5782 [Dimorphilus gyrociliatus]
MSDVSKPSKRSSCSHVDCIGSTTWDDVVRKLETKEGCNDCEVSDMNMWLCLSCLYVGCGESNKDHSASHYQQNRDHSLTLNMSTQRVWCYACETEVVKNNNDPPLLVDLEREDEKSINTITNTLKYDNYTENKVKKLKDCFENMSLHDRSVTPRRSPKRNIISTDYSDSDDDSDGGARGLTGLKNIGNTCYFNAAVQCLSNCEPLKRFFLDCQGFVRTDRKPYLCKYYHKLMLEMWSKKRSPYATPNQVVNAIKIVHPMFKGFMQQDAQEFLRCFMDEMHEELKQTVETDIPEIGEGDKVKVDSQMESKSKPENTDDDGDNNKKPSPKLANIPDDKKLEMSGDSPNRSENEPRMYKPGPGACSKDYKIKYRSIISDLFEGKVLSSVQCLTCERVSTTVETFQDLSLPIPSKECLQLIQSGQVKYQNPVTSTVGVRGSCGEVQQSWLTWLFSLFKSWFWGPNIRLQDCLAAFFSADELKGDNMYSCEKCKLLRNGVKYSKVVNLPEILCIHLKRFRHEFLGSTKINTFVSFPIEGLDMAPYTTPDCKNKIKEYDLTGVIVHQGTAGGGHYTAYACNAPSQSWYEYDDQSVTEVDIQTVESAEAYVLFYKKKESNETLNLRQVAAQLNEQSQCSLMKFFVSKQWINKFNTCAETSPIDNSDFLCKHGAIPPCKWPYFEELVYEVPQPLWEFLYEKYGGGPAVNHLHQCNSCLENTEKLKRRQEAEFDQFVQFHEKFRQDDSPCVIYAINMAWFRKWEAFVKGNRSTPPPPIDNTAIANGRNVRPRSDRGQLSAETWKFLVDIYGGGPELLLKSPDVSQNECKVHKEDANSHN